MPSVVADSTHQLGAPGPLLKSDWVSLCFPITMDNISIPAQILNTEELQLKLSPARLLLTLYNDFFLINLPIKISTLTRSAFVNCIITVATHVLLQASPIISEQ